MKPPTIKALLAQNLAVASHLSRSRGKGPDDVPGGPGLPHHSLPSAPSSSPHCCSPAQALLPLRAFLSAAPLFLETFFRHFGLCLNSLFYCCGSVTKSCPTLFDPMNCSTPGSHVLHYLLEFI